MVPEGDHCRRMRLLRGSPNRIIVQCYVLAGAMTAFTAAALHKIESVMQETTKRPLNALEFVRVADRVDSCEEPHDVSTLGG